MGIGAKETKSTNFVTTHIRRTNRNLLLTNISILTAILTLWLCNAFQGAGYWALVICGLILLASWNIVKALRRNNKPSLHPICIALAKLGPLAEVVQRVNEEAGELSFEFKSALVTKSWLLVPS